jgi:energy-coupling factor transporter ATP-binding protein EcfA2
MTHPSSDQAVICWQCDDPALNYRIELGKAELVQHTLIIGSTGSGKSTLLIDAIRQLIAHQAQSPQDKIGLLILDAKGEDLVARVQEAALRAGRASDVLVFGPGGDCGMDLFGALQGQAGGSGTDPSGLAAAERVTRQVLLGLDRFGGDNAFWWQATTAMLHAGFTLFVASGEQPSFAGTVEFLRRWFFSLETPASLLELVKRLEGQGGRRHPVVAAALDQVRLWQHLDTRTKSNLQSCLLLALQPLVSAGAVRCFSPRSGNVSSPAQAATQNRLAVVSVNALAEPDLARFFSLGDALVL